MQMNKQKFNKNYIDCIIKNQNQMAPTRSCDLGSTSDRNKKQSVDNHFKQTNTPKYEFVSIGKINKIFEPSWRSESRREGMEVNIKHQELIDIFLRKNQEIAASLMKEKKSMSDLNYNVGRDSKYNRYSEDPSVKIINQQIKSKLNIQKPAIFPKIHPKHQPSAEKKSLDSIDYEETQIVMVNDKRLSNAISTQNQSTTKIEEKGATQPQYSDVTNINIKRFLKLKQHTYEVQDKNSLQQFLKKKKIQTHKKRMAKKQRDEVKNSLEAYLETKMVQPEKLRSSCKDPQEKMEERDPEISKSGGNQLEKMDKVQVYNSLPKSLKKIGINTKISKKNLFHQADSEVTIYEQKIKAFREFIFLIKMVHNIFEPVVISDQILKNNDNKYKYFVGKGNNRQLVKTLMKRRFWWIETEDVNEAQFVWTQLKINQLFDLQTVTGRVAGQFYQNDSESKEQLKKSLKVKKISNLYKATFPQNIFFKIMTHNQYNSFKNYTRQMENSGINPQKYQNFQNRRKFLPMLKNNQCEPKNLKVHNHFQCNFYIGNKKALYYNLKKYCQLSKKNLFDIVPLTFHIGEQGLNSQTYKQFAKYFKQLKMKKENKNIWIIKPGENSNRGNGISVSDELYEINKTITSGNKNGQKGHTYIIQKYIERPLLYKGRKFDIRHYMLASRLHGRMRLYFYGEGYVRTSSSDFDLSEIADNQIHLTNDAIQKHAQNYGKYEQGNKISYTELQRYMDVTYPYRKYSLANQFYPKMKEIALDTFKACYLTMDPKNLSHNFEIFGLDFMIDNNFHVWLIEVNTNPCLELSSNLLSRIIPTMLEHSFRLTIDPLFPPPCHYANSIKHLVPDNPLDRLQYQLLFDEARDGMEVEMLYKDETNIEGLQNVEEDQDTFDNDGKQMDLEIQ